MRIQTRGCIWTVLGLTLSLGAVAGCEGGGDVPPPTVDPGEPRPDAGGLVATDARPSQPPGSSAPADARSGGDAAAVPPVDAQAPGVDVRAPGEDALAVQLDATPPMQPDSGSVGNPTPPTMPVDATPPMQPDSAPPGEQPLPAHAAAVWAVGDGEKIERDDTAPPRTSGLWDGRRVRLFGARNEMIAFQLIVRAGAQGISQLSARLPELAQRQGPGRITYTPPGPDPSDFVARPIQVLGVNYMNVTRATNAYWIYPVDGGAGAPADRTGAKPVQLVPENARAGRGGFPLTVAAGNNQALWFDIYTGRDRAAGVYDGKVTLEIDGQSYDVPVELEILDFTLPDENALTAMVYYERGQVQQYQGDGLDAVYHRFGHRQRIELVHAYDQASATAAMPRFNGEAFTAAQRYEGPGEGRGNRVVPASFYGPGSGWNQRATAWSRSDAWMTFLAQQIPGAITFLYMPDEPSASDYPGIRAIAENIHANPGPGSRLPIFVTKGPTAELEGAIDIWCSNPNRFDMTRAAQVRADGTKWWTYNGGRPAGPALVIDSPGTDPRVIGWAAFKANIDVYFYWHANHWQHNHQLRSGERNQNVWTQAMTFNGGEGSANGDGVLLYPGTERVHPTEDRGIAGPISTIQMANLRRGVQDHLYLTLARRQGLNALVDESLQAIVPRVFSEARGAVSFPETTEPFEVVREKLGRALAAQK
jgi:hypothetical protein